MGGKVAKMSDLRPAAKLYIGALALTALAATAFALTQVGRLDSERLVLALALATLMTLSYLFQLPFASRLKLSLGASVIFAAVLLLDPGIAMLITGLGAALAYIIRRSDWDEVIFNSSQTVLQAGAGGLILAGAGWNVHRMLSNQPSQILMVVVAAAAMYFVNTLSVATIIALQSSHSRLLVSRRLFSSGRVERLS